MSSAAPSPPEQGQLVNVRSRQWIVNDVRPSTLPPQALKPAFHGPQHLLTLASVEDDALGEKLQVIWEIEPGAQVVEKVALPEPTGFDPPDRLDAFLDAVRWGAASTADVRSIQSPFRSGIDIEDYQLDPVVRAIQMPRVNLGIFDDVGLGKTIEAGMTALELIIRHRVRRVVVVCPASLQVQWKEQMRDKKLNELNFLQTATLLPAPATWSYWSAPAARMSSSPSPGWSTTSTAAGPSATFGCTSVRPARSIRRGKSNCTPATIPSG